MAIMEDNKFLRRSLEGLKEHHPIAYKAIRGFYLEHEAFLELDILVNKAKDFDERYSIWVRPDNGYAHAFERKDIFSFTEVEVISQVTGIPFEVFVRVAEATK